MNWEAPARIKRAGALLAFTFKIHEIVHIGFDIEYVIAEAVYDAVDVYCVGYARDYEAYVGLQSRPLIRNVSSRKQSQGLIDATFTGQGRQTATDGMHVPVASLAVRA